MGNLAVPVAILLVGALIIFAVSQMLNTERSYKDLVREMQSKKFGNKWIAALELSKVISAGKIPGDDVPWLLDSLQDIYNDASDSRTRNFLVVASGALQDERALPIILQALGDSSAEIQFRAIVALGNMPRGTKIPWADVIKFLHSSDKILQQAAILALATHRVQGIQEDLSAFLTHQDHNLRYSAALALINYKNEGAVPILQELLLQKPRELDPLQWQAIRLNCLSAIGENKWFELQNLVRQVGHSGGDLKVVALARETLKQLIN